jgi:hypothetical protein
VQLTLPRNSRIKIGKTWNRPQGKGKWKEFRVHRWNSEDGENPRIDGYWINLAECGPMVLDGLIKIKNEIDSALDVHGGRAADALAAGASERHAIASVMAARSRSSSDPSVHSSSASVRYPIGTHGLHPANVECPDCTDRSSRLPTHRQCAVVMTEVDNRECERMETLHKEIENARAAVNRAAGLVKGSKNAEVESWHSMKLTILSSNMRSIISSLAPLSPKAE